MAVEEKVTYCRICEALCGTVASVEDGRVTRIRPDPEHPLSRGFACPKGIAMTEVQNDPDRVLHPMRRRGSGGDFEQVTWEVALADIGRRLRQVCEHHGLGSIGMYVGNPSAFSYSHSLWAAGFAKALGTKHVYGAGSQDVNNRFAASALLYGTPLVVPIPDVPRTDFLLIIGANPLVSHGSVLTSPQLRDELAAVCKRGGRVVVCDPRRTETARRFEHVPVRPDSDAWMLLSMLQIMFSEGLVDRGFLTRHADGAGELERLAQGFAPEETQARTGVPPERLRELARAFAAAPGAAAYGRTGSCLGRFGTLVAFLIDAINTATGNLDHPGGAVFGHSAIALDEVGRRLGVDSYGREHSRLGNFPDVLGNMPAALIAKEITTPGPGQLRALIVSAGNPVLSVPNGEELTAALSELDLLVSLDFYVNETGRQADYVLPTTTFLERDDAAIALFSFYTSPFVQYTERVLPPAGEAREEWQIIDSLARSLGLTASAIGVARLAGRLGLRLSPRSVLDLLLRAGPDGDRFGLRRGGLSLRRLRRSPHGVRLSEFVPTGVLRKRVRHRSGRVQLAPIEIRGEVKRLAAEPMPGGEFPLRLIGLRELRSHNSWMHNSPKLMSARAEPALRINPQDAVARGLEEGARATIVSSSGEIHVPVKLSEEMMEGVVAMPHGWGHQGGWRIANAAGGANVNVLASTAESDLEPLAGMAHLNGIPVQVQATS